MKINRTIKVRWNDQKRINKIISMLGLECDFVGMFNKGYKTCCSNDGFLFFNFREKVVI